MYTQLTKAILISLVLTISSSASVLYLELPEEITVEMIKKPTVNDSALIDNFVIEEVNKVDTEIADRVVLS